MHRHGNGPTHIAPASSPFGLPFGSPSGVGSGRDSCQFGTSAPGRFVLPQGIEASACVQPASIDANTGGKFDGHTSGTSSSPSRRPFGDPFGSGSSSCQFGIQALEGFDSSPDFDASARAADSMQGLLEPLVPSAPYCVTTTTVCVPRLPATSSNDSASLAPVGP